MSNLIRNATSYILERAANIGFAIFSGVIMARTFGPENLGALAYVQSISAMLVLIPTLGFDHFIVRDIVNKKNEGELFGTVFTLQAIGWVIYGIALFLLINKFSGSDGFYLCAIVVATTFFSRIASIQLYFQATQKAKVIATGAFIAKVVSCTYILTLVLLDFPFEIVAANILIHAIVLSSIYFISYQKTGLGFINWKFSLIRAKDLLKESWPFIISGAIFPIYMNVDIIMIKHFMDQKSVGVYSVAMNIVGQLNFVGYIIAILFYPKIIELKNKSKNDFKNLVVFALTISMSLSFLAVIGVNSVSFFIIPKLYGVDFAEAGDVLNILSLIWLFLWPAALFTRLLVLERCTFIEIIKTSVAAMVNIVLNFALIPEYGLSGAAVASVFAYLFSDLLMFAFFKKTRWFIKSWFAAVMNSLTPRTNLKKLMSFN